MKLIPDWKSSWRWLSIQIAAFGAAGQAAILAFPDIRSWLPDWASQGFGLAIFAGIILGRLIDQSKAPE